MKRINRRYVLVAIAALAVGFVTGRVFRARTAAAVAVTTDTRPMLEELSELSAHYARRWERERIETKDAALWEERREAWHAERLDAMRAVYAKRGLPVPAYLVE